MPGANWAFCLDGLFGISAAVADSIGPRTPWSFWGIPKDAVWGRYMDLLSVSQAVYGTQITIVTGAYKPTNITGGPHIIPHYLYILWLFTPLILWIYDINYSTVADTQLEYEKIRFIK